MRLPAARVDTASGDTCDRAGLWNLSGGLRANDLADLPRYMFRARVSHLLIIT